MPLLKKTLLRDSLRSSGPYINLATCYIGLGELDQATAYLRDAILLFPRSSLGYLLLAGIELKQHDLDSAEANSRTALSLRPTPD